MAEGLRVEVLSKHNSFHNVQRLHCLLADTTANYLRTVKLYARQTLRLSS